jgi:hypothetical protein
MQTNLFDFETSKTKIIIGVHKGLRGEMVRLVREYYAKHGKLPMLAVRGRKGSDNDRETLLETNAETLKQWKNKNSQRATYSWVVKNLI